MSTSSERQESRRSTETLWSVCRRGVEMPSLRAGSRWASTCGSATTPVPASSSRTLFGAGGLMVPSGTRPGMSKVRAGVERKNWRGGGQGVGAAASGESSTDGAAAGVGRFGGAAVVVVDVDVVLAEEEEEEEEEDDDEDEAAAEEAWRSQDVAAPVL